MDIVTYALSKKYTNDTAIGLGAVKGAPCEVQKVEDIEGGKEITLKWKDATNTIHTKVFKIMDGVTPLMYMGLLQVETSSLSNGDSFPVVPSKFNRQPKDNDLFFSYLIVSDDERIYLYACAAMYDEASSSAIIAEHTKIATTGLKALAMNKAIEHNIISNDPFDVPLDTFNRSPDGAAEECLIFDQYGHYRICSISLKDSNTITVTPVEDVVNINMGSVRFNFTQTIPSNRWEILHSLSFQQPNVLILDDTGGEIEGDIEYYSQNLLFINFSEPVAGTAYLSK